MSRRFLWFSTLGIQVALLIVQTHAEYFEYSAAQTVPLMFSKPPNTSTRRKLRKLSQRAPKAFELGILLLLLFVFLFAFYFGSARMEKLELKTINKRKFYAALIWRFASGGPSTT